MTEDQWEEALKYASDSNNLAHSFGKNTVKHKFVQLLAKMNGDEIAIVQAVLAGCIGKVPIEGLFKDIPVEVEEYIVHVHGVVIDGVIKIGTMFIK